MFAWFVRSACAIYFNTEGELVSNKNCSVMLRNLSQFSSCSQDQCENCTKIWLGQILPQVQSRGTSRTYCDKLLTKIKKILHFFKLNGTQRNEAKSMTRDSTRSNKSFSELLPFSFLCMIYLASPTWPVALAMGLGLNCKI